MDVQPSSRILCILVIGWACVITSVDATMRHISQCRLCHLCHITESPPDGSSAMSSSGYSSEATSTSAATSTTASGATGRALASIDKADAGTGSTTRTNTRRKQRVPAYDPELDPTVPVHFKPSSYRPRRQTEMASLPECAECYGCRQNLTLISDHTVFLNNTYTSEMGATSSWIFRTQSNMTPGGEAVVKVYCIPVPKRVGGQPPTCNPLRISEIMKLLMSIDKLSGDCGFRDLIPRMWLAPVLGVLPGFGYPIDWWGLWMEYVEGISLENFLFRGIPRRLPLNTIADVFNNKLNKTRIVLGAIFDLLTSQCDRHAQNLFLQEDGNLKLIDNESCLQHMWRNCGFDSVLVPTTQKQEIVRLANQYVNKLPTLTGLPQVPRMDADPQLLLDYRCYLPKGQRQMGTNYPAHVDTCLRKISAMTPKEVQRVYGLPELRVAANLHSRATDMITRGYEWAAKYGQPQNPPAKRYHFQPPCCSILVNRSHFSCAHPWQPSYELPVGNPFNGREWDKDRPDPGTYVGGVFPEDEEPGAAAASSAGAVTQPQT